jgi:hypothetical protein
LHSSTLPSKGTSAAGQGATLAAPPHMRRQRLRCHSTGLRACRPPRRTPLRICLSQDPHLAGGHLSDQPLHQRPRLPLLPSCRRRRRRVPRQPLKRGARRRPLRVRGVWPQAAEGVRVKRRGALQGGRAVVEGNPGGAGRQERRGFRGFWGRSAPWRCLMQRPRAPQPSPLAPARPMGVR